MTTGRSTLTDVLAAAARHLVGAVAGLALVPLLARALGAEGLGSWTLIGTLGFVLGIADLGLTTTVQRSIASGDRARSRVSLSMALAVVCIMALPLALLGYVVLAGSLPPTFGARPAAVLALAGGVVGALTFPHRGFVLVSGGMRALALARAAGAVTQILFTLLALAALRSLVAPALGMLVGNTIELALTLRAARAIDPDVPCLPRLPRDRSLLRSSLRDGAATLVVNLSVLAALRADVLIIAGVAPLAMVAAYGIGARAVDQAYLVAKQVSAGMMPRLASSADRAQAVRSGTGVMGILVASGMPALALAGRPLLVAWGGEAATSPACSIAVTLLGGAAIVVALQEVAASSLTLGARTAWPSALALAAGSAVNVVLSVVGSRFLGIGAVAAATVLGNLVTAVLVWRSAAPMLGWSAENVARAFAPALASLVTAVSAGLLVRPLVASAAASALASGFVAALGVAAGVLVSSVAREAPSNVLPRQGES